MILSCAQASACARAAQYAVDGATALGWHAYVVDGKGDPAVYNSAIRAAVVAKVDGIVDIAVPSGLVQDALRFAQDNKVPVVNSADLQSNDPKFVAEVPPQWALEGTIMGQFIVADSNGKANVVLFRDDEFPGIKLRFDKIAEELNKCAGCKILDQINLTINDVTGPRMGQVTKAQIDRFGTSLKYMVSPYDAAEGFIIPTLKSANRTDIKEVGFVGGDQQTKFCNQGLVAAIVVDMDILYGWGPIDELNRHFAGMQAVDENVPSFLVTPKTCPATGRSQDLATLDVPGNYKKLWGV